MSKEKKIALSYLKELKEGTNTITVGDIRFIADISGLSLRYTNKLAENLGLISE